MRAMEKEGPKKKHWVGEVIWFVQGVLVEVGKDTALGSISSGFEGAFLFQFGASEADRWMFGRVFMCGLDSCLIVVAEAGDGCFGLHYLRHI